MKRQYGAGNFGLLIISFLVMLLIVGCTQTAESCPPFLPVDISEADKYFTDEQLPFQFPLDNQRIFTSAKPFSTNFAGYGRTTRGPEYHAAEDILDSAGTPVYAMADGRVSFSGPMKGYGWLIIIDHPQANLYSLYGHLSPSRWQIETGRVKKGELIGYLGDSDENGGSAEHPLITHLHFGVRTGQRSDYPGMGQWRWQAGWIKPCPQDLGWLQPSLVITGQDIHYGKFNEPIVGFMTKWWVDLLLTGIYVIGGACMLIFAVKKNKPFVLVISSIALLVAGWIFFTKGMIMSYGLFTMAVLLMVVGIYKLIRRSIKNLQIESE
jgi:hypothetical protein